jgi:hypothetical protein
LWQIFTVDYPDRFCGFLLGSLSTTGIQVLFMFQIVALSMGSDFSQMRMKMVSDDLKI